jgi:Predicted kinase
MRAAIRAKVTAARMELAPPAERPPIARAARGYFALALEAIAPPAPKLAAVGGLSGTGKTVLARAVAPRLKPMPGAVIVRSGYRAQGAVRHRGDEKLPADAYEEEVTARVYATLTEKARRILAAGHSAIVDAVFADPRERAGLEAMAKSANIPLRGLFSPPTSRPGRRSARARATPPTPTPAWRRHRSVTTSDRSNGRLSMPPERRRQPWRGHAPRSLSSIDWRRAAPI